MKYIVKTTAMTLIGGLFTAGLVLAAAENKTGNMSEGQQLNTAGQQDPSAAGQQDPSAGGQHQPSALGQQQPSTLGQQQPSTLGQQQRSTAGQQQLSASSMDGKQVRELQKALNEKGYAVGTVDGIVGPKTMGALRDFQSKEGLSATGQPDQQTLKALGIDVGQQEFMGVSPEFGEEQPYQPEATPEAMPMEPMERTEQMPMQRMDQQSPSPGAVENK